MREIRLSGLEVGEPQFNAAPLPLYASAVRLQ
jgi:hypothetical protein